jgi:hypothetical protein
MKDCPGVGCSMHITLEIVDEIGDVRSERS